MRQKCSNVPLDKHNRSHRELAECGDADLCAVEQSHPGQCAEHGANRCVRSAANRRERRRVRCLNRAFQGLRDHVPGPTRRALSKVDTLRLAIGYITFLSELLRSGRAMDTPSDCTMRRPQNVVIFHGASGISTDGSQAALSGHSLSWRDERPREPFRRVRTGRVWTPEVSMTTEAPKDVSWRRH